MCGYINIGNRESFNPCFNGTMYKNIIDYIYIDGGDISFNPCFNGTMYKNWEAQFQVGYQG